MFCNIKRIDNRSVVEVGGADKGFSQLKNEIDAYVAADDIDSAFGKKNLSGHLECFIRLDYSKRKVQEIVIFLRFFCVLLALLHQNVRAVRGQFACDDTLFHLEDIACYGVFVFAFWKAGLCLEGLLLV